MNEPLLQNRFREELPSSAAGLERWFWWLLVMVSTYRDIKTYLETKSESRAVSLVSFKLIFAVVVDVARRFAAVAIG